MLVNQYLKRFTQHLYLVFASLLLLATLIECEWRTELVTALLLLLPLLDFNYKNSTALGLFTLDSRQLIVGLVLLVVFILLVLLPPQNIRFALITLFFVALPEEWFFRAYFMTRLESALARQSANNADKPLVSGRSAEWLEAVPVSLLSNLMASLMFALMHLPLQGLWGLMVFFPSLLLGYLYQCLNNLYIVALMHAIFNLVYINYLVDYVF